MYLKSTIIWIYNILNQRIRSQIRLSLAHIFGGFIHDTRQNNFLLHLDKDKYRISYNKHDSDQSYNNGIFFSLYGIPANVRHNPTWHQNLAGSLKLPVSYVQVGCCCLLTYVLTDALSLLLVSCLCEEGSEWEISEINFRRDFCFLFGVSSCMQWRLHKSQALTFAMLTQWNKIFMYHLLVLTWVL